MAKKEPTFSETMYTNGGKFSFPAEVRNYKEVVRQYWPLIMAIGLFFGWLLSFPFQGPIIIALAQSRNVDPLPLIAAFLIGHIIGQGIAGIGSYYYRRLLVWFDFGAIPCIIISVMLVVVPAPAWIPLFLIGGIFSGLVIISWGVNFVSSVSPDKRSRTFILGAVAANIILYIITLLIRVVDVNSLLIVIGLLPLGLPIFLSYWYRRIDLTAPTTQDTTNLQIQSGLRSALPFIFIIYTVGGLMYFAASSLMTPQSGPISFFGLIPYIIFLFVAGSLGDLSGRRMNAFLGAIFVGLGFMTVGLLKDRRNLLLFRPSWWVDMRFLMRLPG